MTMMVMQASRIGIRTVPTSMILKPFLYVVAVVAGAQTAGNDVVGKSIAGFNALLADFHSLFQNRHQHFTLRNAIIYSGRTQNCVIERQILGFAYFREAGEFSLLNRHVYRLADRQ